MPFSLEQPPRTDLDSAYSVTGRSLFRGEDLRLARQLIPDIRQGFGEAIDQRIVVIERRRDPQPLHAARHGTPRKLEVDGEDQAKVVYRLIDPAQYRQRHVLVVGGGDSALEAAASIAEQPGTSVTLSHRSEAFPRAKARNRERVKAAEESGQLNVLLQSSVTRIGRHDVEIEQQGRHLRLRNDAVIVCAGGILPTALLKGIGIEVETKYGTA